MSTVGPALTLTLARARRRPWRALAPALGIALAAAFLGAVWAEGTIAGEQAARSALSSLTPAQRAVTITWQGAATPAVDRQARAALSGLGLGPMTTATLLSPVRLNGHVVRPAAIAPLAPWTVAGARSPGPCRATTCPMLLDGTGIAPGQTLAAPGVRLPIAGTTALRSAAPLGFVPGQAPGAAGAGGQRSRRPRSPRGAQLLLSHRELARPAAGDGPPLVGARGPPAAPAARPGHAPGPGRRLQHGRAVRRAEQRPVRGRRRPAPAAPGGRRRDRGAGPVPDAGGGRDAARRPGGARTAAHRRRPLAPARGLRDRRLRADLRRGAHRRCGGGRRRRGAAGRRRPRARRGHPGPQPADLARSRGAGRRLAGEHAPGRGAGDGPRPRADRRRRRHRRRGRARAGAGGQQLSEHGADDPAGPVVRAGRGRARVSPLRPGAHGRGAGGAPRAPGGPGRVRRPGAPARSPLVVGRVRRRGRRPGRLRPLLPGHAGAQCR